MGLTGFNRARREADEAPEAAAAAQAEAEAKAAAKGKKVAP